MRPTWKRHAILSAVGLLLTVAGPAAAPSTAAGGESGGGELSIQIDDGMLTVRAREIPQGELLEALAKKLGFDLVLVGSLNTPRSLDLRRMPWEEVLKKVLPPASWSVVYDVSSGSPRPTRVTVFPAGAARGPGPAPRAGAAPPSVEATVRQVPEPSLPMNPPSSSLEDATADEVRELLSALRDLAARESAVDVAHALSELSGQPEDAREVLRALESQPGQSEDVKRAIREMLQAIEKEAGPTGN